MPLPKKLNPADFRADPGKRRSHVLYLPEHTVYALDDKTFATLAAQMPDEPHPSTLEVDAEEAAEEHALDALNAQIEEKDTLITNLTAEVANLKAEVAKLKAAHPAPVPATPAPTPPAAK